MCGVSGCVSEDAEDGLSECVGGVVDLVVVFVAAGGSLGGALEWKAIGGVGGSGLSVYECIARHGTS